MVQEHWQVGEAIRLRVVPALHRVTTGDHAATRTPELTLKSCSQATAMAIVRLGRYWLAEGMENFKVHSPFFRSHPLYWRWHILRLRLRLKGLNSLNVIDQHVLERLGPKIHSEECAVLQVHRRECLLILCMADVRLPKLAPASV